MPDPFDHFKDDLQKILDVNNFPNTTQKEQRPKVTKRVAYDIVKDSQNIKSKITKYASKDNRQLKIYRGMSEKEAIELVNWDNKYRGTMEPLIKTFDRYLDKKSKEFKRLKLDDTASDSLIFNTVLGKDPDNLKLIPVKDHFGAKKMAETYSKNRGGLVEFVLKAGAHRYLFSEDCMAIGNAKNLDKLINHFGKCSIKFRMTTDVGEGTAAGYIGVKSENIELGGYSLCLGKNVPSKLLFQLLISKVNIV